MSRMISTNDIVARIRTTCSLINRVDIADSVNQILEKDIGDRDGDTDEFPFAYSIIPTMTVGAEEGTQEIKQSMLFEVPILVGCRTPRNDFEGFDAVSMQLFKNLHGWHWNDYATPLEYRQGEPRFYTHSVVWYLHVFQTAHLTLLRC